MSKPVPLFDERAEAGALGSCLMLPEATKIVLEMLRETDFYLPRHRLIFRPHRALSMTQVKRSPDNGSTAGTPAPTGAEKDSAQEVKP